MSRVDELSAEFDLQPDPRILPMLGEINLSQWRCVAELVDNAADAFISAREDGSPVQGPEVHVQVPTADSGTAMVVVRDNGPGMDADTLEKAVRAGWTGNDPIGRLGMFGMGFNIATARLGSVTRVWTTRECDAEWCGLEINFEKLTAQRSFRTPKLARPKMDPQEHGTEVRVERLKPEQRAWFARTANRSRLEKELGRTYSAMLRPNGVPVSFRMYLNGDLVRGRVHCIWGGEGNPERAVQTARYGTVNSYQTIDRMLSDRGFCTRCWQWLRVDDTGCPSCGSMDRVVVRKRRVHGWVGIQRYLSAGDYGIDFVRNGRKIEVANRDLFSWTFGAGEEVEYPRDDQQRRGRIVGEIHIDHCRVSYTKDRFDRNDPAWEEMYQIVHGEGPLQPDKAAALGAPPNSAPLFVLFQVFRRSSPKPKVAGCWAKLLLVPDNSMAEEMAKRFHAGETQYQTDAKWWELVWEADTRLLPPTTAPGGSEHQGDLDDFGGGEQAELGVEGGETGVGMGTGAGGGGQQAPTGGHPQLVPQQTPIPPLSREYVDDMTRQRWDVRAYEVESRDPRLGVPCYSPWVLVARPTGLHDFLVNPTHPVFRSATMTLLDALLSQLAWSAADFLRGTQSAVPFAAVLASLRDKYAGMMKLDPATLSAEAAQVLGGIARSVARNVSSEDSLALYGDLFPRDQEAILRRMATRAVSDPQHVISGGRFLEYAPGRTLAEFFREHPELFLDGHYWDRPYAALDYGNAVATEEARAEVVNYYAGLIADAVWLADQDVADLGDAARERLLRAVLAVDLLAVTVTDEET